MQENPQLHEETFNRSPTFDTYLKLMAQPQWEAARGQDPANSREERRKAMIELLNNANDTDLMTIATHRARFPSGSQDVQQELQRLRELAEQKV